ncbi:MAG TPA: folylpolyglutamate synthase/dihydrofolate synthase family protein, partial [Stellaceae bacterium]|nr:folylpolyglutamate synthase/dihydrofolate synthase family protein [Stellaceae bacterium]
MNEPAASDRVLARLMQLHPKRIDLSLGRIERLLGALGNPQDRLPPVVHVAGTNGKGSTVATLRACLEAGGYHVHVYISPHLVRFHERIRLAGELIDEDALLAVLEECERANAGRPITFFEITTAAALLAFSRAAADVTLLEVGMGGRLDTTNVVRRPAVTAITPISLDHQAYLGDTIAAIAGEKAGILKPGVPAVIGPQEADAAAVIAARAAALGAPLSRWRQEWHCDPVGGGMRYAGAQWRLDLPLPSLAGAHQIANAGTAIACLEQLPDCPLPPAALARGLRHIDWPARLQRLKRGPLVALLPPGWELWLDGGHNPAAGAVLAEAAAGWRDRPLSLIVGMLNTKDAAGFLAPLAPYARALCAVT